MIKLFTRGDILVGVDIVLSCGGYNGTIFNNGVMMCLYY